MNNKKYLLEKSLFRSVFMKYDYSDVQIQSYWNMFIEGKSIIVKDNNNQWHKLKLSGRYFVAYKVES